MARVDTDLALIYDERCLAHDNGSMLLDPRADQWLGVAHVESAERIRRSWQLLERSGVAAKLKTMPSRPATEDEIRLVHTAAHLERIDAACRHEAPSSVGPGALAGRASREPILLAAGAGSLAVEWVLAEPARSAFALIRPPGHHASADRGMGFCVLNNAAIAARVAQRQHGLARVAIVDWDVHHGNGTEDVFYDDPSVLFCSLHQDGLYPAGRGLVGDSGTGPAAGTTLNVPLPPGTGGAGYLLALETVVEPALRAFGPELLIVSAGQDPGAADPLGRMSVTAPEFARMTRRLLELAKEVCDGRMVTLQEGGYNSDHMPYCNLAIVEAMGRLEPTFATDPLDMDVNGSVREIEREAIAAVADSGRREQT